MVLEEQQQKIAELLRGLLKEEAPLSFQQAAMKVAEKEREEEFSRPVKIYDPECDYEVGDLIYKEFKEKLRTGRDRYVEFEGPAILKVVGKKYSPELECYLLTLEYEGEGPLKEHFDYLKRARIEFYLPSYATGKKPQILPPEKDPRMQDRQVHESKLREAKKLVKAVVEKVKDFYWWGDKFDFVEARKDIPDELVRKMEDYVNEKKSSASTEELVEKFLETSPADREFGRWCLSLNYTLEHNYKLSFVAVSYKGWGRWNTWSNLVEMQKDLPIVVENDRPPFVSRSTFEIQTDLRHFKMEEKKREQKGKFILGWREVLSGAVRVGKYIKNHLPRELELQIKEKERGRYYTVYYFPEKGFILGLKDYFKENFVVQGTQFFLEWNDESKEFEFYIRRAKKPFHAPWLHYKSEGDLFILHEGDISSEVEVPKHIFITRQELEDITSRLESLRKIQDLTALLREVLKSYGEAENSFRIHYIKAYHIVDLINAAKKDNVILALIGNEEFVHDSEEWGFFSLDLTKAIEIPIVEEEKKEEVVEEEVSAEEPEVEEALEEIREERERMRKRKQRRRQRKHAPSERQQREESFFAEKLKEALKIKEEEEES